MQATTKSQAGHTADKQLFNAAGVLLQFLASPDEVGDAICLIRGTMEPGVVVPLHSHAEPEILYVLNGSLQVYRSTEGTNGWTNADVGDVVIIPGSVKHALRDAFSLPGTLALVTKSKLYQFFRELAKPFDPSQPPFAPTPEAMQELFEAAAKYGYWLGSPAENAAIGLNMVQPRQDQPTTADRFQETAGLPSLPQALPNVKVVIIGCADMCVDPADMLGIKPGEAVVMRNIGGRITLGLLEQLGPLGRIGEVA